MSLAPRLDLRQSQSLVMTPQLQQAIKLLALSNLEIEGFIAEELAKNPLLEIAGPDDGAAPPDEARADPPPPIADGEMPADRAAEGQGADALDVDPGGEDFAADGPSDRASDAAPGPGGAAGGEGSGDAIDFDRFAAEGLSLQEHLLEQARTALSGCDLMVAIALIERIEETGYLLVDEAELAAQLGVSRAELARVIGALQRFDPAGVGARNLAECLAIQAREADRYDPCMAALIANLDLLAKGAVAQLKRICRVDDEDFADMVAELRGYDPKPGCRFARDTPTIVVPDLFVRQSGSGWAVEINGSSLPRVLVNRAYHVELAAGCAHAPAASAKASRAWLGDCLAQANWLVKALDQRQQTIAKVAAEIVARQDGFFRHGVAHLRPLTLRMVAEAVGLHESTVSRVTSNKYLSCARGTFELKYFFTSAIQGTGGGEAVSATAVRSRIAKLIGAESGDAILSDDTLVDLLRAEGFDIARRTVAKYREALGIGSSVQRRRARAIAGN